MFHRLTAAFPLWCTSSTGKKNLLPLKLENPLENICFFTELLSFIRHLDFSSL